MKRGGKKPRKEKNKRRACGSSQKQPSRVASWFHKHHFSINYPIFSLSIRIILVPEWIQGVLNDLVWLFAESEFADSCQSSFGWVNLLSIAFLKVSTKIIIPMSKTHYKPSLWEHKHISVLGNKCVRFHQCYIWKGLWEVGDTLGKSLCGKASGLSWGSDTFRGLWTAVTGHLSCLLPHPHPCAACWAEMPWSPELPSSQGHPCLTCQGIAPSQFLPYASWPHPLGQKNTPSFTKEQLQDQAERAVNSAVESGDGTGWSLGSGLLSVTLGNSTALGLSFPISQERGINTCSSVLSGLL